MRNSYDFFPDAWRGSCHAYLWMKTPEMQYYYHFTIVVVVHTNTCCLLGALLSIVVGCKTKKFIKPQFYGTVQVQLNGPTLSQSEDGSYQDYD